MDSFVVNGNMGVVLRFLSTVKSKGLHVENLSVALHAWNLVGDSRDEIG